MLRLRQLILSALMVVTITAALALMPAAFGDSSAHAQVSAASLQDIDEEVPPGNPVIGSDRPGDLEFENDTNYGLWALLAVCLIGAGTLLVKIERWESRRRSDD